MGFSRSSASAAHERTDNHRTIPQSPAVVTTVTAVRPLCMKTPVVEGRGAGADGNGASDCLSARATDTGAVVGGGAEQSAKFPNLAGAWNAPLSADAESASSLKPAPPPVKATVTRGLHVGSADRTEAVEGRPNGPRTAMRLRGAGTDGNAAVSAAAQLLDDAGVGGDAEDETHCVDRVLIAPIDVAERKRAEGWSKHMTAADVHRCLEWQGHTDVLQPFAAGGLRVLTVNPHGKVDPYLPSRRGDVSGCRLPYHAALVESGVVDIVILPEAHVSDGEVRNVREYVATLDNVHSRAAPSSAAVATMEHAVSSKAISSSTHSGIVVLMPTKLAASLQSVRHYHSGRVLHLHLRDALQRDLHVIAVYGVSSPMQNAAKQRLNADVHQVVATLLARYAGSAILVAGDINTAWRAQDRQSGQLERYDTNPHALWKLFSQHGLSECHTVAWSERTDMTFKPNGKGVSRIDGIWANAQLRAWPGARSPPRSAVATFVAPLSADHAAVAAQFDGSFQWESASKQQAVACSAQPRPRRVNMTQEKAMRFRVQLQAQQSKLHAMSTALYNAVGDWAAVARALNTLNAPCLTITHTSIAAMLQAALKADAARGIAQQAEYAQRELELSAAAAKLRSLLQGRQSLDLTAWRQHALESAGDFFTEYAATIREAYEATHEPARAQDTAASRSEVRLQPAEEALRQWQKLKGEAEPWERTVGMRVEIAKLLDRTGLMLDTPDPAASRHEWERWAEGSGTHGNVGAVAELCRLAGQSGATILRAGTLAPLGAHGSRIAPARTSETQQLQQLSGKGGGGKIDGLLIDVDATTGDAVPCTDHDALCHHLQQELLDLGCEKGVGTTAYASTAAFHASLFDTECNWRGTTRAFPKQEDDMRSALNEQQTCMKQAARQVEQARTAGEVRDAVRWVCDELHFHRPPELVHALDLLEADEDAQRRATAAFASTSGNTEEASEDQIRSGLRIAAAAAHDGPPLASAPPPRGGRNEPEDPAHCLAAATQRLRARAEQVDW